MSDWVWAAVGVAIGYLIGEITDPRVALALILFWFFPGKAS